MTSPGQRTICIGVDDFGVHVGINSAALRLVCMGRVHAVGCVVGGPAWNSWGRLLSGHDMAGIDVGLQLDFTGHRRLQAIVVVCPSGDLDASGVRSAIRWQLDAFEHALSRAPAFVKVHQHVHQLPTVRSELLAELAVRYGGFSPWRGPALRINLTDSGTRNGSATLRKPWVVECIGGATSASVAHQLGYPQNRPVLGGYDCDGGVTRYRDLLAGWLRVAVDADLLVCHPSLALDSRYPAMAARHAEYQVLSRREFGRQLEDGGIGLAPLSRHRAWGAASI